MDNERRPINVYSRLRTKLLRMRHALAAFHEHSRDDAICLPLAGDARRLRMVLRQQGVERVHLVVTSPPYWNAQNYQGLHRLSFLLFGLPEPAEKEIGRKRKDYLEDMRLVVRDVASILDGHFALVIGTARDGTHEEVRQLAVEAGMEPVDTITRTISNHAFFAKSVKEEYIYIFRNAVG
jgi:hypothetical protein